MLRSLQEIFDSGSIEIDPGGTRRPIHSHTPLEQGLFLQNVFDSIRPQRSLEVGMALGISTMFILEKHKENESEPGAHIVIEPDMWGTSAMHNIEKEGLLKYVSVRNDLSDRVIPELYREKHSIQLAYVDTTKLFDTVFQDFYFIDKILDVGGVVILDDCEEPGVNKVARFINALPHYRIFGRTGRDTRSLRRRIAEEVSSLAMSAVPFRQRLWGNFSFRTNAALGLDYRCIAFQKVESDSRPWNWDGAL